MPGKVKYLCAAAALCLSGAAIAQDSGWSISEADGQVSVIRDGKAIYGASGTPLEIGDVVRTSKSANAVLVRGEDFFVVAPDKKVRIKPAEKKGAVAGFFEYVGDLLTPNDHAPLRRSYEAAVVKGLDTSFSGTAGAPDAPADPAQKEGAASIPADGSAPNR